MTLATIATKSIEMTPTMTPIRVVLLAKPSKVVYICFTLLQMTVESRDLSSIEKNITVKK